MVTNYKRFWMTACAHCRVGGENGGANDATSVWIIVEDVTSYRYGCGRLNQAGLQIKTGLGR